MQTKNRLQRTAKKAAAEPPILNALATNPSQKPYRHLLPRGVAARNQSRLNQIARKVVVILFQLLPVVTLSIKVHQSRTRKNAAARHRLQLKGIAKRRVFPAIPSRQSCPTFARKSAAVNHPSL